MPELHNKVDLHIHSNYSDGTASPAEIIHNAYANGLHAIALTDHDTVDGIQDALNAADKMSRSFIMIPGVEISADYKHPLHILGYFHQSNYMNINPFLAEMKRERHIRNQGIINKLNNLGIRVTMDDVKQIAGKEVFGRPHIAAALISKGFAASQTTAFNDFLSAGRKAYVSKRSLPPDECVAAIADAGGLPVIAHPSQIGLRLGDVELLAQWLIKHGLFGIEAYYPEHTPKETANYLDLARNLNISATGGSDYHGDYRKHIMLGSGKDGNLFVPDSVLSVIVDALHRF